eukprot:jgi/Botrbrau1/1290/Bobra.0063s0007.1
MLERWLLISFLGFTSLAATHQLLMLLHTWGLGTNDVLAGAHWHVQRRCTYTHVRVLIVSRKRCFVNGGK